MRVRHVWGTRGGVDGDSRKATRRRTEKKEMWMIIVNKSKQGVWAASGLC